MNKKIKLIIIVIIVVVLAIVGYAVYKNYRPISSNLLEAPAINSRQTDKSQETKKTEPTTLGWKLYKNSEFGFEIQYPETWIIAMENIENVRGEQTKGFFFKKPNSDLRFAILPRDGLSYGLPNNGTSSQVFIGGSLGAQSKWTLPDGRRLWLIHPQYGLFNWSQDIGRIDILSSAADPASDTQIFEEMLNSFKLSK